MSIFNRDFKSWEPHNVVDPCELCRERSTPGGKLVLFLAGTVAGMFAMAGMRYIEKPVLYAAQFEPCAACHATYIPPIPSAKVYKKVHRKSTARGRKIAAQLEKEDDYLIVMIGGHRER